MSDTSIELEHKSEALLRMTRLVLDKDTGSAVHQLRTFLRADEVVLFIIDDELDLLLPAPGFSKTLPRTEQWREMLNACTTGEVLRSLVAFPSEDALKTARAMRTLDGSVLVAVGDAVDEEAFIEASAFVPLAAAALRGDLAQAAAAESTNVARQAASQMSYMAGSLDRTRLALQEALREASSAKERLEEELQQRVDAERELRILNQSLEERIEERTTALRRSNEQLKNEVAERLKAQQALEEANNVLRRNNQRLQEFAFAASHDLQEPVRKIVTFADLLEEEIRHASEGDSIPYFDRIRDGALRLSTLINDLLQFSRLTQEERDLEEVDLTGILSSVLENLEVQMQDTGGHVQFDRLPTVVADPTQMRHLFQNLISNALKYHRPDVPPAVRVYEDARQMDDDREVTIIRVEDDGIGFDQDHADRIFAPFRRLHSKDSRYPGTGIGLTICRHIVERHGGTIRAESNPGTGTTFVIHLPIEARPSPKLEPST